MPTRRVVTGINAEGESVISSDGRGPVFWDRGSSILEQLWQTDRVPPEVRGTKEPVVFENLTAEPPPGGSVFRVVTVMPEGTTEPLRPDVEAEVAATFREYDANGVFASGERSGFHITRTIDFVIILSGEVDLEMDNGSVHLKPGDCVVQRETRHAWRNRGNQACVMAGVQISTRESQSQT